MHPDPSEKLELDHGTVDLHTRRFVPSDGGPEVPLTQRDVDVLQYLAQNSDRKVDLDELMREVWGADDDVPSRTVDTAIHRLRVKLEPVPSEPRVLLGGIGEGVRLVVSADASTPSAALPRPWNVMLGRDRLVADVLMALASGATLVVLVGEGGVGKSRIALEIAHHAPRSAWFVSLDGVQTADELRHTVAAVIGVRLPAAGGDESDDVIGAALTGSLLVLDHLDPCLDAAATLIPRWMRAPGLHVVGTSGAPLLVAGEEVIEVPPLGPTWAVDLFLERAETAGRRPSGDDLGAVQALIGRIGGNPLAVELAAAWAAVLDPAAILTRIEEIWAPAGGVIHAVDPMSVVVRASWMLLTAEDQEVLLAASVFPSAFDPRGVAALTDAPARVPAALLELRRKGFLWSVHGGRRLQVPDVVRRFVSAERTKRGDPLLIERYAAWSSAAAVLLGEAFAAGGDLRSHERELGALVAGLHEIHPPDPHAMLLVALAPALEAAGWTRVHFACIERALRAAPSPKWHAPLLQRRVTVLLALGGLDMAERAISFAEDAANGVDDDVLRAEVALDRATLAGFRGNGDRVVASTHQAADVMRHAGEAVDPARAGPVWGVIGANLLAAGDRTGAEEAYFEVVRYARIAGSHLRAAVAFTKLANMAIDAADSAEATARVGEAEAELRVLGLRASASLMRVRGALAELRGDWPLAEAESREMANLAAAADEPWTQHEARLALARCAIRRDALEDAWALLAAASAFARGRWTAGWVEAMVLLGVVYVRQGVQVEAQRIRDDLATSGSDEAVAFVDALLAGQGPGRAPEGAPLTRRLRYALVRD